MRPAVGGVQSGHGQSWRRALALLPEALTRPSRESLREVMAQFR